MNGKGIGGAGRFRQSGQIAPVALFGVLVASTVLILMYNAGQKVTEKSQVANAADAAAYSGAVWTARHFNFMAYTNRAMIANHAAVGHFVSYVSWIRYIDDTIDFIDNVTQFIPYIGQYIDIVQQIADQVRRATDQTAQITVPSIDGWNSNFRAAQVEAQASLALNHLNDLMQRTAQSWDPDIRINDRNALAAMPDALRSAIELQLLGQLASVPTFVRRYAASGDDGAVQELIAASLTANDDMKRWISGERGWRENMVLAQIRKQGSTTTYQNADGADWKASDQLRFRTRGAFSWHSWQRIGTKTSRASATEFDSDYQGVPAYYNVSGSPGDRSLRIAVVASKPQARVNTRTSFGMSANAQPLAVAAMARVEFHRPVGSAFAALGSRQHEYANLFNPFWDAKLVAIESGTDR